MATDADLRRLRARRQSRVGVAEIDRMRSLAVLAAFRAEMGEVVRSTSPLLISLLALDGLTLDDAVALFRPSTHWPYHLRLPQSLIRLHFPPSGLAGARPTQLSSSALATHRIDHPCGGYLVMQVLDHSLDFFAKTGRAFLETRFGELRVELDDELPETLFVSCVGRTIDEVVDHDAWRGRGWRIVATEDACPPLSGQTLVVATGSVLYRLPWFMRER